MGARAEKQVAIGLFWFLLLAPLLLSLVFVRSTDFASVGAVFGLLGRLTGIVGLTCLLLAAALISTCTGV